MFRRLTYRYHRWQYQREMAMPTPTAPRQPRNGPGWRTWRRVRHPFATLRHWRHGRDEAKPVPPPMTEAERRGGPLRRTYRRVRVRMSHTRHSFTDWPLAAQVPVILVAAGVLVAGVFGAKNVVITKRENGNAAAFTALGKENQDAVPDKAAGQKRVLVAGDYNVLNLADASDTIYQSPAWQGLIASAYSCPIADSVMIVKGEEQEFPEVCRKWRSVFADNAHFYVPDVNVLMTGTLESYPHVVDGKTITAGTPEMERYLFGRLDAAREALGGNKVPLVLVTPLCTVTPQGGINLRLGAIASVWDKYAKTHPGVTVLNPSSLTCPGGKPGKTANGKAVLDKSGLFTKDGAKAMWGFIVAGAGKAAA